jgi:hypothetical protein
MAFVFILGLIVMILEDFQQQMWALPFTSGGQMGPFYELESVAPAAFLRPGEAQVHRHAVYCSYCH